MQLTVMDACRYFCLDSPVCVYLLSGFILFYESEFQQGAYTARMVAMFIVC